MKRWVDYVFNLSRLGLTGKARVHAEISAQIITLGTLLHTSYLVYNVWIRAAVPYQLYAISLTIIGISVMLFRHGHIRTAQLLFLLVSLWFIAAFAITAPRATNTHLHLISVLLLVFTFFQDVPRVWLYLSSILIATIFIVAALPGLEWLPRRSFSEPATQRYFVINSVLFFTAITFFLRWLLELHRRFESESRALAQRAESKKTELEDVNKSLDRIVYTVTHDLLAPLNRLQGLIDLSEKVPAQEVGEYHTMMRKQIGSMKAYIQDIVEYNRNSKTGIDETQLEVGSLVK